MTRTYPPPFQDLRTLSEHICVGESTIERWVSLNMFPAPHRIGGKRLWRWKEVEKHLAARKANDAASAERDRQAEDITNATRAAAGRH
jgi:predicted DNA-binding transcriptional regulator AlpA